MDVEVYGKLLATLSEDDDHPYRTGPWRPQNVEYNADDLTVEGELPEDLHGVYLRNTENPLHPALVRYHPFDGDGMIHKVSFRDGRVSYRNRFVRTDGLLAEQAAGRSLWAGIAENPDVSTRPDGWGARGKMKDAASTDVVVHAGVAVASFYQCGDLYRLDPLTLDDLGKCTWGGSFPSDVGVSAHTKVDEHTGELLFFNYATQPPYLHYGVVDADSRLAHYVPIDLPGPRLPHDMAFTEHYAILNDMPLFWEPDLLAKGRYVSRFHPELPFRLGVIPRREGAGDVQWFEFEPTYVLHWTNAYELGDEIIVEGFFQGLPGAGRSGPERAARPDVPVHCGRRHADATAPVAHQHGHPRHERGRPDPHLYRVRHDQRRLRRQALSLQLRVDQSARLVPVQWPGEARQRHRPRGALRSRARRVLQRGWRRAASWQHR